MAPSFLKVLGGPLAGKELILEDAVAEVVVGADPSCTFRLELPAVSPIHARLRREAGGVAVHDAGSPRGVFVNDDRVQGTVLLRSGDILWLGPPGDSESVMIRCRLAPATSAVAPASSSRPEAAGVAAAAPPPSSEPEVEPFFIADASAPEASAPAPAAEEFVLDPAAEPPPVVVDSFFVEEPGAASTPPAEDAFFIAEPEAAATPTATSPLPAAPTSSSLHGDRQPPPARESATVALAPPVPEPMEPASASTPPVTAAPPPTRAVRTRASSPPTAAPSASQAATRPAPAGPPSAARTPGSAGPRKLGREPEAAPARPPTARPGARGDTGPIATPVKRAAPPTLPQAPVRRYGGLAAAAVVLLGGGYVALRFLGGPRLATVTPTRAKVGQSVTLVGKNFASDPNGNRVLFGDEPGKVVRASSNQLEAEVPELPTTTGRDVAFSVTVEVAGRRTNAVQVQIFQSPRIHGLSPDVAMPGDELTLAGSGWAAGATVSFGALPAEVLQTTPTHLRVRVPAIEGPAGTSVPVRVAMGDARSNEAPFMVGRLPLIQRVEPATAAPGDVVMLSGRGFHVEPQRNSVQIGGVQALVVGSDPGGLQVVVPWAPPGKATMEIRVPGSGDAGQATLGVAAPAESVEWRFAAEPFEDSSGHAHAFVGTVLGPAFVLSASDGKSAAERAVEAAQRLNEAAGPLRASLDADFEARGASVRLTPKGTSVLEATPQDAAAYDEDWTRQGDRGGPVTPERLAFWWAALARDLVLVVLRSQKPTYTAAASEGRILGEVYQAARRTSGFGLPRQVVADLKPAQRQALRLLAQRVPASLAGPAAASGRPGAASLRLQGHWTGFEIQDRQRKNISLSFGRSGGTLTFTDGVGIGVPLLSAETPQRNTLRFSAQVRGGVRYYLGNWDGERIKGRISSDASGRNTVGNFELTPGP